MRLKFFSKTLIVLLTVPAGIALGIGILAPLIVLLERNLATGGWSPFVLQFSAESARTVLSVIAGGAMTALSLTYSLVLVVFTLAASNIGPRLLKRFTSDLTNQVTAGIFGGTFLYSLGALFFIQEGFVPKITIFFSGLLSILSVMQLIYFVRHVSQSVTIDDEIAEITDKLIDALNEFRDKNNGDGEEEAKALEFKHAISCAEAGYIGAIDEKGLCKLGRENNTAFKFSFPAGHFVLLEETLFVATRPLSEEVEEKVRSMVTMEDARSAEQTVGFSVNLLVEIALRALSPGVNDTYTAIAVVDSMSNAFGAVAKRDFGASIRRSNDDEVRLILPTLKLPELFDTAFHPLRRAARDNILMCQSLARAYARLYFASGSENKKAIKKHAGLLLRGLRESSHFDEDIKSVRSILPSQLCKNT